MEMVQDALDQLRGAVMIVYPMGLPPYDPIRMEFENKEDLSGTQVGGSPPASSPWAGPPSPSSSGAAFAQGSSDRGWGVGPEGGVHGRGRGSHPGGERLGRLPLGRN